MKILTVTNLENNPRRIHCYAAKCTDDMFYDVETAFEQIEVACSDETVKDIEYELRHGRNFWHNTCNEDYCFEIVVVPEV